jgi:hypothetical protein
MDDLTYKEYVEIIVNSGLGEEFVKRFKEWVLPGNRTTSGNEALITYGNKFVCDLTNSNKTFLVSILFEQMDEKFVQFLKYKKWKDAFIENAINKVKSLSGSPKNVFIDNLYTIIKSSDELSLSKKENREFFLNLFRSAADLKNKNEEESLVQILQDIFKNKEQRNIDLDFFKELFAIYIEFINTNPKYQNKINAIKNWAKDQDFSALAGKYKNIRHYFEDEVGEKIFNASVKTYDLKDIAKKNKIKNTVMQQNFFALNQFLDEKLKGNSNIQNFIALNENIFFKVLIVYEKRDRVIDAAINMHETFFEMIKGTENVEYDLMDLIWEKLSLKANIETSLGVDNVEQEPALIPRKVKKI